MVLPVVEEERSSNIKKAEHDTQATEAVAFCPQCKALQTIWVNGNTLMSTSKFHQKGNQIYHDCGSSQPCRLYHSW